MPFAGGTLIAWAQVAKFTANLHRSLGNTLRKLALAFVSFLSVFPSDRCKFAVNLATYAHAIKE